jgi:hypothetical protein
MLQGVPVFIMRVLLAALFCPALVRQRGLRFAPARYKVLQARLHCSFRNIRGCT